MALTEDETIAALPRTGWLREYIIHGCKQTTAPLCYHLGVGITLLGVTCPLEYHMEYAGRLYGNNFTLLVGRSGEDNKSTALNVGLEILKDAAGSLIGDMPGSPEGLIESLQHAPTQVIPISEFGKFLSSAQRGYFEPTKTLLADVWDCTDRETEVLTEAGWISIAEVQPDQFIYAFDANNDCLVLTHVKSVGSRLVHQNERMIRIVDDNCDIYMTEGHDFYFKYIDPQRNYAASAEYLCAKARDLIGRSSGFYLPAAFSPDSLFKTPYTPDRKTLCSLKLMAAAFFSGKVNGSADYCISYKQNRTLARNEQDTRFSTIQTLLTLTDTQYSRTFHRASDDGQYAYVSVEFTLRSSSVVNQIAQLTVDMFSLLCDLITQEVDSSSVHSKSNIGSHVSVVKNDTGSWQTIHFYALDASLLEHLLLLGLKNGYQVSIFQNKLTLNKAKSNFVEKDTPVFERAPKDLIVYCVETEHGTMLTRRNNKIIGIGNCTKQTRVKAAQKGQKVIISVDNPRLSIAAACSIPYLEKHTLAEDWTGGFMGRWLVMYGRRTRVDPDPIGDRTKFQWLSDELRMRATQPTAGYCMGLSPVAKQRWVDWYTDVSNRRLPDNIIGIRARAPTMCRKIALILAWDYGEARNSVPWQMDLDVLEPAIAICELHIKSLVHLSGMIAEHEDARVRRSILQVIEERGGVATLGNILESMKRRKRPIQEMLDSLLEEGRIKRIQTLQGLSYELQVSPLG